MISLNCFALAKFPSPASSICSWSHVGEARRLIGRRLLFVSSGHVEVLVYWVHRQWIFYLLQCLLVNGGAS